MDYFTLTPTRVNQILASTNVTSRYQHLLGERDEAFRERLKQELTSLVDDAVEMAFLVIAPECTMRYHGGDDSEESSDEEEDESHDYEYKGHCDDCTQHWIDTHDLYFCITEGEVDECGKHYLHTKSDCDDYGTECPSHPAEEEEKEMIF